ncbi:MAG: NfeD family protein [Verrucomicrobiales bacterium]
MEPWHYWTLIGFSLIALEMLSGDFVFACFGAAAFAAAGAAGGFEAPLKGQLGTFAIAAAVFLAAVRPAAKRLLYRRSDRRASGVSALVGQRGVVADEISAGSAGRVKLGSEEWRAIHAAAGSAASDPIPIPIPPGAPVEIVAVSGATLEVRPL